MYEFNDRENARSILRNTIERMSSRPLTDAAMERAVSVAEKMWTGSTPAGNAAKAGLLAVESDLYK